MRFALLQEISQRARKRAKRACVRSFSIHTMKPILAFLTLLASATAQETSFPEVYNSEPDKSANPPSPQEAFSMFQLPGGI